MLSGSALARAPKLNTQTPYWHRFTLGDAEILFLNEPIPAAKALDWGLVNWVVPSVRRGEEWIEHATAEELLLVLRRRLPEEQAKTVVGILLEAGLTFDSTLDGEVGDAG